MLGWTWPARPLGPLLAVLLGTHLVGTARAEDDPCRTAYAHFDRGSKFTSERAYDKALEEFTTAYDLCPNPATLYTIAGTLIALNQQREAIRALLVYLGTGCDRLPQDRCKQVEDRVILLADRLHDHAKSKPSKLVVSCPDPGLVVLVDGASVDPEDAATGIPVAVGSHRVALFRLRRRFREQTIEISEGERVVLICEASPSPAPVGPQPRLPIDGIPVFPSEFTKRKRPPEHQ